MGRGLWAGAVIAAAAMGASEGVGAAEAQLAVAANFAAPMKALAQAFERQTGHKLVLAFGATGQLYAQVRNGAPFAALLAADSQTPQMLEREGLGVAGSRFTYATGRLALWSPDPLRVDAQAQVLRTGAFDKLALANPKLAPYGAAALQTLQAMGLHETLAPKIVQASSVSQVHQFVASGNAALGFLALSQVQEAGRLRGGSAWIVPASLHQPLRQDAILLQPGRDNPAAIALLAYLRSPSARSLMQGFGYEP